ncbi:FAD synthase [[Mycoplasma] gypis]|uniref:FAD synthase n=1 Tax=[Mycoplasma] gypis TaxID=92404 RepID=A0ABZ2RMN3_9BACT|nr:riboflavin biosynthesis protein [[Mycoplasma] gypis]MBN0919064.1 riboflavin biosynthesis protein [[Mycoplasma] gypis]
MDVYKWPLNREQKPTILVLGAFESLHIGHYGLFKQALNIKKSNEGFVLSSLLFDQKKLNSKKPFQLKTRIYTLDSLGVDETFIVEFNDDFKNQSPINFIEKLKAIGVQKIVVGEDFRFGFNRQGTVENLKKHFDVTVIEIKKISDYKISTTIVKELIKEGKINTLNNTLIDKYAFICELKDYQFDFPDSLIKLPSGIYFANVVIKNIEYHAIVLLGYESPNKIVFLDLDDDIIYESEAFVEILAQQRLINHIAEDKIFKVDTKEAFAFFTK